MEAETRRIVRKIKSEIAEANIPEIEKFNLLSKIVRLEGLELNIMITGVTGSGKRSTINALFNTEVGFGVEREPLSISKFRLDNFVVWEAPGLVDRGVVDGRCTKNITNKLLEKDSDGDMLIDLVIVILDGSTEDWETSYELINDVIIPALGENKENRLLIAINKVDMAMSGQCWRFEVNRPNEELTVFLDEKLEVVKKRIKEETGIDTHPIYYSAGYKKDNKIQKPYRLVEFWKYIFNAVPRSKRIISVDIMQRNTEIWEDDISVSTMISQCVFYEKFIIGDIFGNIIGNRLGNIIGSIIDSASSLAGVIQSFSGDSQYNKKEK